MVQAPYVSCMYAQMKWLLHNCIESTNIDHHNTINYTYVHDQNCFHDEILGLCTCQVAISCVT